jgi:hypothetical protein
MRRARALSRKRCCLTLKRSPGQWSQRLGLLRPVRQLKWTSMRTCGAKRPCRRHALLFAYEMLSQKCSATDKLFGNSLSVVGTSAWRERRLSPIRCYGPNRLRLRQLISFFFFAYQSKTDSIFSESVSHWPTPNSSLLIKPAGCNERPLLRHKRPITTDKLLLEIYPVTKPYQCTKSTAFLGGSGDRTGLRR